MTAPRPLFVFGVARSGTNLVARMLSAHPEVAVALDPLMPLFRAWRNAVLTDAKRGEAARCFDTASSFQDYYFDPAGAAMLDAILDARMDYRVTPDALVPLREGVMRRAALEMPALAKTFAGWSGDTIRALFDAALGLIAAHIAKTGTPTYAGCSREMKRDGTYNAESSFSAKNVMIWASALSTGSDSGRSSCQAMSVAASHCAATAWS